MVCDSQMMPIRVDSVFYFVEFMVFWDLGVVL